MYKSTKTYSCPTCETIFKNAKSLSSHKYKFHSDVRSPSPTLHEHESDSKTKTKTDVDWTAQSDISSTNDEIWDSQTKASLNKMDIDFLESTVKELRSLIYKLDTKVNVQDVVLEQVENYVKTQKFKTNNNALPNSSLNKLEWQMTTNSNMIKILGDQIDHLKYMKDREDHSEPESESYDTYAADLIDDMVEIGELFSQNNFEKVNSDIPKLRQAIKIMLKTFQFNDVDDEDVQLLHEIANSSKGFIRQLLRSKFTHLVNIFKQLKPEFVKVYETEDKQSEEEKFSENEDTDQETSAQSVTEQDEEVEDETQFSVHHGNDESDVESDRYTEIQDSSDESESETESNIENGSQANDSESISENDQSVYSEPK